jgi:two-component system chemotaxis response regulator CheB
VIPVRVVVIAPDDVRRWLVRALTATRSVAVVGHGDALEDAGGLVRRTSPDVVVLDLGLPGGSANRVITEVMAHTPRPILALAPPGPEKLAAETAALAAGVVEVLPRPADGDVAATERLRRRAEVLRGVSVIPRPLRDGGGRAGHPAGQGNGRTPVVALAASTGGPQALGTVLAGLRELRSPVLVVQHLHAEFLQGLVSHLARSSGLPVELATDGVKAEPGVVYVGPNGCHLRLGTDRRLHLDPEPATIYVPSADQLFSSVARTAAAEAVGVLLTGMGEDGAAGLLAIRQAGGTTIVQDEASSAVFGMPAAAQRLGAAGQVLPLDRIAPAIMRAAAWVTR